MIKTKSKLLVFDKYDKINNIFPKECVVTIPEFVPVTNFNSDGPDHFESIGMVTSHDRNDSRIEIEIAINFEDERLLKKLIEGGKIYSGGYYIINKAHRKENGVLVMDNIELKSVGLYLDDVYGDNDLRMEVMDKMIKLKTDCTDCTHSKVCQYKYNARLAMDELKRSTFESEIFNHVDIEFSCPDFEKKQQTLLREKM